jgi:hypothetical protein
MCSSRERLRISGGIETFGGTDADNAAMLCVARRVFGVLRIWWSQVFSCLIYAHMSYHAFWNGKRSDRLTCSRYRAWGMCMGLSWHIAEICGQEGEEQHYPVCRTIKLLHEWWGKYPILTSAPKKSHPFASSSRSNFRIVDTWKTVCKCNRVCWDANKLTKNTIKAKPER